MNEAIVEKIVEVINTFIIDFELTKDQVNLDLVEVGLDSISFIQMVLVFEEELNVEIPDSFLQLSEMNTVNKIKNIVNSLIESDRGGNYE